MLVNNRRHAGEADAQTSAAQTVAAIEAAVAAALAGGARSPDLGGTMSTAEMGDAVLAGL